MESLFCRLYTKSGRECFTVYDTTSGDLSGPEDSLEKCIQHYGKSYAMMPCIEVTEDHFDFLMGD